MPAKKAPKRNRSHPGDPAFEKTREKIQATQIANRLQNHILGKVELSPTQVQAAKILLGKVLPDLSSVDQTSEVTHNYAVSDRPMSKDEWTATDYMGTPAGASKSTH